jgi:hypothetical protein
MGSGSVLGNANLFGIVHRRFEIVAAFHALQNQLVQI